MWPFKPRPLVVNITAHVAQPGDTVLLTTDKPIAVHLRDEFISGVRKVFSDAAVKVIVVSPDFSVEVSKDSTAADIAAIRKLLEQQQLLSAWFGGFISSEAATRLFADLALSGVYSPEEFAATSPASRRAVRQPRRASSEVPLEHSAAFAAGMEKS